MSLYSHMYVYHKRDPILKYFREVIETLNHVCILLCTDEIAKLYMKVQWFTYCVVS